jgi:hypothetical protein
MLLPKRPNDVAPATALSSGLAYGWNWPLSPVLVTITARPEASIGDENARCAPAFFEKGATPHGSEAASFQTQHFVQG